MAKIGDIYKVIIYYKGKSGKNKPRPVLIINTNKENNIYTIAEITSISPKNNYYSKFKEKINNWQQCGLYEPSYVKCRNIHNIEENRLYEKIGTMEDDLINILYKIVEYNQ